MVNRANGHRANDHRANGNRADVVAPLRVNFLGYIIEVFTVHICSANSIFKILIDCLFWKNDLEKNVTNNIRCLRTD